MEDRGRFVYFAEYLDENGGKFGITPDYYSNEFELEAEFYDWAYEYGYLDIYGHGEITDEMISEFRRISGLSDDWYPNKSWQ